MSMGDCLQWAEKTTKECSDYRDEGYSECDSWDANCCDWWPCSWGCKLITWVCVGWYWVSSWVCVAWAYITSFVCVLWEGMGILVGWLMWIVALFFAIPFIGRFVHVIWDLILDIAWRIVGIVDEPAYKWD